MKYDRELPKRRPIPVRVLDWQEVYEDFPPEKVRTQGARCMDCGIPFCHTGCPLGNLIPEWNDLVYRDRLARGERAAARHQQLPRVHRPAVPGAVRGRVRARHQRAAGHDQADRGRDRRPRRGTRAGVAPVVPATKTGKRVAVVGSGPAGLAAAQQLTRAGHDVTVYERADRIGGLLRYGIPEFKMEKRHLDRRIEQMEAEGTEFRVERERRRRTCRSTSSREYDAVVLAGGATAWRDLPVPGPRARRHLPGDGVPAAGRTACRRATSPSRRSRAQGKHVVIIGGGDTGADCLGTAIRQGAASVHQFEILPRPPDERADAMPWPTYPMIYRVASAHEEGGERVYAVNTECFLGDDDGNVRALRAHEVEQKFVDGRMTFEKIEGTDFELPCELVLLAMGFVGPQRAGLLEQLGVELNERGNVARDEQFRTNLDNVFVCGDMGRGQSLIVWAIAEGRSCAAAVDRVPHGRDAAARPDHARRGADALTHRHRRAIAGRCRLRARGGRARSARAAGTGDAGGAGGSRRRACAGSTSSRARSTPTCARSASAAGSAPCVRPDVFVIDLYAADGADAEHRRGEADPRAATRTRSATSTRARGRTGGPTPAAFPADARRRATAGRASAGSTSARPTCCCRSSTPASQKCVQGRVRRGRLRQRRRLRERHRLPAHRRRPADVQPGARRARARRGAWPSG